MNENVLIQFSKMDPKAKLDDVREACRIAREHNFVALDVPQWFVSFAKEELAGSDVAVSTCVGLPGGETSSFAKYAEVKEAVRNGADEVEVPLNMALLAEGNTDLAKNDLNASMAPAIGKAKIKAVIEAGSIGKDAFIEAVKMVADQDVDMVVISNVTSGKKACEDCISAVKKAVGDKCVAVMGGVSGQDDVARLSDAGADRVIIGKL